MENLCQIETKKVLDYVNLCLSDGSLFSKILIERITNQIKFYVPSVTLNNEHDTYDFFTGGALPRQKQIEVGDIVMEPTNTTDELLCTLLLNEISIGNSILLECRLARLHDKFLDSINFNYLTNTLGEIYFSVNCNEEITQNKMQDLINITSSLPYNCIFVLKNKLPTVKAGMTKNVIETLYKDVVSFYIHGVYDGESFILGKIK